MYTMQKTPTQQFQAWHAHATQYVRDHGAATAVGSESLKHLDNHLAIEATIWVLDNRMMLHGTIWEQFQVLPGLPSAEFELLAQRYLSKPRQLPSFTEDYPGVQVCTSMSPYDIEVVIRAEGLFTVLEHQFPALDIDGKTLGAQLELLKEYWFAIRAWSREAMVELGIKRFGGNLTEAETKLLQDVTNRIADQVTHEERAVLLKAPKLLVDALSRVES